MALLSWQPLQAQTVLETYVEIGLEQNLGYINKKLETQFTQSRHQEAIGDYLPSLTLNARYSRAGGGREIQFPVGDLLNPVYDQLDQISGNDNFPTINNELVPFLREKEHETKLNLVQQIIHPAIFFNIRATSSLSDAQTYAQRVYARQLVYDIKEAYYSYLKSREGVEIVKNNIKVVDENLRVNESLYRNDKITKDILLQAKSRRLEMDELAAEQKKQHRLAKYWFNHLLHRELTSEILLMERQGEPQKSDTLFSNEQVERREELNQLKASLDASKGGIKAATSQFLPTLLLAGEFGYQGEEYLFNKNQKYWMVSGVLQWNLFNGFKDKEARQQAIIRKKQLESRLEITRQKIVLDIQQSLDSYTVALETFRAATKRLETSREAFRLTRKRYQNGMTSYIEYLNAENAQFTSQRQESLAYYDLSIVIANIERARATYPLTN